MRKKLYLILFCSAHVRYNLLLESGDNILLENGTDAILLES